MKDIKDHLHLYLGCDVAREHVESRSKKFFEYGRLVGASNSEVEKGKTVAIIDVGLDHFHEWYIEETKPILRPLSDMTEQEAWEFVGGKSDHLYDDLKIDKIDKTGISISYVINAGDEGSFPQSHKFDFFALGPEQFKHLLSRGFDLFNLIPEGLAIDKTTIKPEISKEH
jgi:hypothetical protein